MQTGSRTREALNTPERIYQRLLALQPSLLLLPSSAAGRLAGAAMDDDGALARMSHEGTSAWTKSTTWCIMRTSRHERYKVVGEVIIVYSLIQPPAMRPTHRSTDTHKRRYAFWVRFKIAQTYPKKQSDGYIFIKYAFYLIKNTLLFIH